MTAQYDALINAPFGALVISAHNNQLAIELLTKSPSQENKPSNHPVVKQAYAQIMQYLQQPKTVFNLPITAQGTAFQQSVWRAIVAIPIGETRTYSQIAEQVGSGPRAVANACGANLLPILIPCHRVLAKNGLGGFMQAKQNALCIKQWLLKHEGVHT